jgi:acetyltransferase-like isoleucine patch superfamily enzyme
LLIEKLLHWCIVPTLRADVLRLLGAKIGQNVRIYEARFINLENGFKNLQVGNDVHIGTDCLLDLKGVLHICSGSTLSPRVVILTHQDPGKAHDSPLLKEFPAVVGDTSIGEGCWIGANATIISGVHIGAKVVVASGAVVIGNVESNSLVAGVPAKEKRKLH